MQIERSNPPTLFNSLQYGFSQVVAASGDRIISVSGQVAWTADQTLCGKGNLYAETTKALENLQIALQSVQADLSNIISLRIYIVDYNPDESDAITRALQACFPAGTEPTATWIGVSCLANPEFRIEIEALAIA